MHLAPKKEYSVRDYPDAPWMHTVQSTDVDEHAGAQPQWSLKYDQLSCGQFLGAVNQVQLPGLRLVYEASNCGVRQRGQIGEGCYGFAMTVDQPGEAIFNGQRLDRGSIMMGRSEDLDLSSPPMFSMIAITVDGELLGSLWERMYQKKLSTWLDHQIVVQARSGEADTLRASHGSVLARLSALPGLLKDPVAVLQIRDEILIEWIEAIPMRVDISGLKNIESRKRVVQRACDMVLSQPDQAVSMLQLCNKIGASPRKLEYCFNDILGISPAKYLRTVRLNGVRRDIKRKQRPVIAVCELAARWGFWHLGEFSALYKRQFGELPSETLRQART
jgi:AraC family ethanolamine operon transcriptional activator